MRVKTYPILVLTLRILYVNAVLAGMNAAQRAVVPVGLRQCVHLGAVSVVSGGLVKRCRISREFGACIYNKGKHLTPTKELKII